LSEAKPTDVCAMMGYGAPITGLPEIGIIKAQVG
jgi:hypothetical protein